MYEDTHLTKATTSSADGLLESPRKSINACTTLAATSENFTAQTWMDWMRSCLYSGACVKTEW